MTLIIYRILGVSYRGGSGTSTLQLSNGDAKEPRDPHPGRQEMHGHREHWWTADSLPGCHIETWNDASIQLCSAAGPVRRPPQWHGKAPVLPRLRLFLQGCKYTSAIWVSESHSSCVFIYTLVMPYNVYIRGTALWLEAQCYCENFPLSIYVQQMMLMDGLKFKQYTIFTAIMENFGFRLVIKYTDTTVCNLSFIYLQWVSVG